MRKEPYFVTKINKCGLPESNKIILGDINGDGILEMVMLQADGGIDDRYVPHQITCITAIDILGNVLWQAGTPVDNPGGMGSDFPAQIYDIDGDGSNEVICVMEKRFKVFDGKTGALKAEYDLPDEHAHDCIILANLSGEGKPKNVILKNRYKKMWAMNHDFTVMWTHEGKVGHFPYPYDINGDGYDEIMAGYDMLDHNGNIMWSVNMTEHADCIFVADLYDTHDIQIVIGGSTTGVYDTAGKELCRYDGSVETQHVAIGKYRADIPGVQISGLDRIVRGGSNARDAMFLLNNKAELVWKEDRKTIGWLTIVETIQNWDDTGLDYILAYRRGGGINPTIYDGYMNEVTVFPVDGYVAHASIFGDGYEDVIIYNKEEINIFSPIERGTDIGVFPHKNRIIQPKRLYCSTLYPGGELAPRILPGLHTKPVLAPKENETVLIYDGIDDGNYEIEMVFTENDTVSLEMNRRLLYESKQPADRIKFAANMHGGNFIFKINSRGIKGMSMKKTAGTEKTVYLAGDSTVCDQLNTPFAGWGQMLQAFLPEGFVVSNHAQSGRSTKSFIAEKRLDAILDKIKSGDYLFIQFAHNDQKPNQWRTDPFTTYKQTLKIYIDAATSRGAIPVLVTPVYRRRFDDKGCLYDTHGDYPVAVRQLAAEENVFLIDLHEKSGKLLAEYGKEKSKEIFVHAGPGAYKEHPDGIVDDTHFSHRGAYELAKIVAVEFIKLV